MEKALRCNWFIEVMWKIGTRNFETHSPSESPLAETIGDTRQTIRSPGRPARGWRVVELAPASSRFWR
jgi:hypothetical protein